MRRPHSTPTTTHRGWCLSLRQTDAARFEKSAKARGFVCAETLPFMVLDGLTESSLPEQLAVRQVTDIELAREHFELVARSFGAPFVLFEPILGTEFRTPTMTALIGDVDGPPAATSLLCMSSGAGIACAGVYNVGTLESHRRRGIGEAMTAHAAELGRVMHGCLDRNASVVGNGVPRTRTHGLPHGDGMAGLDATVRLIRRPLQPNLCKRTAELSVVRALCSTRRALSSHEIPGSAPGRIRTSGLRIRRPTALSAVLNSKFAGRS